MPIRDTVPNRSHNATGEDKRLVNTASLNTRASASGTAKADVIELDHVSKTFPTKRGELPVVTDVSLALAPGDVLCLVGESGCGKTTTGKMVAGLVDPSAGRVLFEGRDVASLRGTDFDRYRRAVQIIHQDPYASLNPARSVYQTLSAPLKHYKLVRGRNQLISRIHELLELVDLTPAVDFIEKYPHQLSGGQRQRVAVARALTVEPRFIVADESVSMLDVSIRMSLLQTLLKLKDELGVAFIFITHDLALARYFGWDDQIGVMYLGRIVELGKTPEVIENPSHPYTRALIAAVPDATPVQEQRTEHVELRSMDIPSLYEVPRGCGFHPRCPLAEQDLCDRVRPPLYQIQDQHQSACHVIAREEAGIEPARSPVMLEV